MKLILSRKGFDSQRNRAVVPVLFSLTVRCTLYRYLMTRPKLPTEIYGMATRISERWLQISRATGPSPRHPPT